MTKILLLTIACALTLSGFAKNSNPTNKLRSFVGKNHVINDKMKQRSISGYKAGIIETYVSNGSDNSPWVKNDVTTYTYDNMGNTTVELSQRWDTWTNVLVNSSRTVNTYDNMGNKTSQLSQSWNNNAWVNSSQYIYTFNTHNDQTEDRYQTWENNTWVTSQGEQYVYTYDGNNNKTVEIQKEWVPASLNFINSYKTEYKYSNNANIEMTGSAWDNDNNVWNYNARWVDLVWYNFAKDQPLSYTMQEYFSTYWANTERYTYTYSGDDYIMLFEKFVNGNWISTSRETHTHTDTYGSETYLSEDFINGNWVKNSRETSMSDSKKNQISYKHEDWQSGAWVKYSENKYIYTYDVNNNITSEIYQTWDSSTQLYKNDRKYVYSNYQIILDVPGIAADSQINMFPNPTIGRFAIQFQDAQQKTVNRKVEIYNLLGEKVYSTDLKQQTTNEIDLSKSPKGIYMVQVYEGAKVYTRKIVVQ